MIPQVFRAALILRCCLAGDVQTGSLTLQHGTQPELGSDVSPLALSVERVSRSILRVKLGAAGRWEVPRSLFKTENITLGAPLLGCRCLWPWQDALLASLTLYRVDGQKDMFRGRVLEPVLTRLPATSDPLLACLGPRPGQSHPPPHCTWADGELGSPNPHGRHSSEPARRGPAVQRTGHVQPQHQRKPLWSHRVSVKRCSRGITAL